MAFSVAIVSKQPSVREVAARVFTSVPAEWDVGLYDDVPARADVVVAGPGVEAPGAVRFDPARPDAARGEVEARARRRDLGRVFAVAGAVGGAGATSVALHLAAQWGDGTCYAELAGPGGARRLGLPPETRTWLPRDDDVAASALPVPGGFRLLHAPDPCPGVVSFPLAAATATFERVVLDLGTAPDELPECAAAVVVAPPTRPAAEATRGLLDAHADVRWAVVVNRAGPGGQIMRAHLEGLIGRRIAVELPCCPALRDAEDQGRLLSGPWHRWRRRVALLAEALDRC